MKFLVCAVVLLAVSYTHAAPTPEQMEKIQKAVEVCQPKTGATDDDLSNLMKHEIPDTKTGQCFVACLHKEIGTMTADNKVDVDRIKEMAAPLKEKDSDKYAKGLKVVETCAAEVNGGTGDECELAKKMMECSKKEAAATGILMGES